jgi:hypothetical protein
MKRQLICALLASARVAAPAGDLGRPHDGAYQVLITGLGTGPAHAGQIRRVKEQPDRVKSRLVIVAIACGGLYCWRGGEIRAKPCGRNPNLLPAGHSPARSPRRNQAPCLRVPTHPNPRLVDELTDDLEPTPCSRTPPCHQTPG